MKDIRGASIKVGDVVAYACKDCGDVRLKTGIVRKIYTNDKECTVDSTSHVFENRIMKIN